MAESRRIAMRVAEVVASTGASEAQVREMVRSGALRAKRVGRALFVCPEDVERIWGFPEPGEGAPSARVLSLVDSIREEAG